MAKRERILIPNDFLSSSIADIIQIIEKSKASELDIILAMGKSSSTSITELIGISKDDIFADLQSKAFIKSCQVLIHHFSDRNLSIYTDIVTSSNPRYIKNYIKGNRIDKIAIATDCAFVKRTSNHFDLRPVLLLQLPHLVESEVKAYCPKAMRAESTVADIFFKEQLYAKS